VRIGQGVRVLLPALGIPVLIGALSLAVQSAALPAPTEDSLVAAATLRELLRYRVMTGAETVAGRRTSSVCVDGWFRSPARRRPVRGALVLLGDGTRLYDVGTGVRRLGRAGLAGRLDRARFLLAGCPRVVGADVTARLVHGRRVDPDPGRLNRAKALTITLGHPGRRLYFVVAARTYKPLALEVDWRTVRGRSTLYPAERASAVARVERRFDLPARRSLRA
jgi:hypothetical protein